MYRLKKLADVDPKAKRNHAIVLGVELGMVIVHLGFLIYNSIIGDPQNRIASCCGGMFAFMIPFLVENIFKTRLSIIEHVIADVYMFVAIFLGSVLNLFKTVGPFDEIIHFCFGYFSCLFFFYIFLGWEDTKKLSPGIYGLLLLLLSMALSSIWEIVEFTTDVFMDQNSLGYPPQEVLDKANELGLTGIAFIKYKLENGVGVWDTVTDMSLHLLGSILFYIHYVVEKHINRTLMFKALEKEYYKNKMNFYEKIETNDALIQTTPNANL